MRIFKWMADRKRAIETRKGLEDFYRVEYRHEWEQKNKKAAKPVWTYTI